MDLKDIKAIIDLMKRSDLSEFEIEDAKFKLRIRRDTQSGGASRNSFAVSPLSIEQASIAPIAIPATPVAPSAPTTSAEDVNVTVIKSPMVGTFYRSPSPDSPSFVNNGSKVTEKTAVCIIEAMKVMNEIHAEVSGTIIEILAENGQAVEYGQPLFKVRKG